jgi:hypothetical protein
VLYLQEEDFLYITFAITRYRLSFLDTPVPNFGNILKSVMSPVAISLRWLYLQLFLQRSVWKKHAGA